MQNGVQDAEFMGTGQSTALAPMQQMGLEQTISQQQEAMVRATVEARYALAIRQPRDLDAVRLKLLKDCKRPRFAEVARYSKPQGGSKIEGPSIRFVESALRCYGNVIAETSVIYEDQRKRVVRVCVTDLEANLTYPQEVTITKTIERSNANGREIIAVRQNKSGRAVYVVEATDDEILIKQNSLISKTLRTLGLRILPGDLVEEAQDQVIATQNTQDKTDPEAQRRRVFDAFAQIGITPEEIKEYMGREVAPADLVGLRGLYQALRQGDVDWREVLAEKRAGEEGDANKRLREELAKVKAKASSAAPAQPNSTDSSSPAAMFSARMGAAADLKTLDAVYEDAKATLTGDDLTAATRYYLSRTDELRKGA